MKTVTKFRRRIQSLQGKLKCEKCPIRKRDCDYLSNLIWGETRCLLKVVLSEVLIFHADKADKKK